MQEPIKGKLALTEKDNTQLKYFYKGFNQLGEKGVAYLSKAKWAKFNYLNLSIAVVSLDGVMGGSKGCGLLRESNFKGLTHLFLGIQWLMKRTIKSGKKVANTLVSWKVKI